MRKQKNTNVIFAGSLRELMKVRGVTQAALATELGITQGAISNYLRGRVPRTQHLFKIAHHFGVTTEALLAGKAGAPGPPDSTARGGARAATNPAVGLQHWLPLPNAKSWDRLSDDQRNRRAADWFFEGLRRSEVKVTSENEEHGSLDVKLDYRSGRTPKGLPRKVRLQRPEPSNCFRLIEDVAKGRDSFDVLFACLPAEFQGYDFLSKLNVFFAFALREAAVALVFGREFVKRWRELSIEEVRKEIQAELSKESK